MLSYDIFKEEHVTNRFKKIRNQAKRIRASEYHITNACNIRCKGCWFFEKDFDTSTGKEVTELDKLEAFVKKEKIRGINTALLIGGEPTLFLDRVKVYVDNFDYVSISTNGLKKVPYQGFEDITVFISLFGGGKHDDELRAIKPSGKKFTGLLDTTLANYKDDPRVTFVYALSEDCIEDIEATVLKIKENGNKLSFNYYSKYGTDSPIGGQEQNKLMMKALEMQHLYPETILSNAYYIRVLITGKAHWGEDFGYDTCPSISIDHPDNSERIKNGNRTLPLFNTYAPDLKTINFCCTSGECSGCRDSQAVYSWMMMSSEKFIDSPARLNQWMEMAEGYWKQFIWSDFGKVSEENKMISIKEI